MHPDFRMCPGCQERRACPEFPIPGYPEGRCRECPEHQECRVCPEHQECRESRVYPECPAYRESHHRESRHLVWSSAAWSSAAWSSAAWSWAVPSSRCR